MTEEGQGKAKGNREDTGSVNHPEENGEKKQRKAKGVGIIVIVNAAIVIALLLFLLFHGDQTKLSRWIGNWLEPSEIQFIPTTSVFYSLDGGNTWSEEIQAIPISTTYYAKIEMQIQQSEKTKDEKVVVATVVIPDTKIVDCFLDDHPGQSITGHSDPLTGKTSYDFKVAAGINPMKFKVFFECLPLKTGRVSMEIVYDDTIPDQYDKIAWIKYVSSEKE